MTLGQPTKCFWLEPVDDSKENPMYRRTDTGETMLLTDAPPGAMWDADWLKYGGVQLDGKTVHLVVRLPNGHDWMPGGSSNNCNRRDEDHDCWCVHGTPPELTVDKNPEPGHTTCTAGGGSVQSGNWHGFLQQGYLVQV